MSEAPAMVVAGVCIGFDHNDPTKQCPSLVDDTTTTKRKRFCKVHSVRVRGHYLRYKQLTQQMQDWYQRVMQEEQPQQVIGSLQKLYGLLDYVGSLRRKFTQSQVHPSCRDQGHQLVECVISRMKTSVEKRLRHAFLLATTTQKQSGSTTADGSDSGPDDEDEPETNVQEDQDHEEGKGLKKATDAATRKQARDVEAYLARCIAENASAGLELLLDASQAYRRTFLQVWLLFEHHKLLSSTLLLTWYQEQKAVMCKNKDNSKPVPDDETIAMLLQNSILVGSGLGAPTIEWEGKDEEEDNEADASLFKLFQCFSGQAISPLGEFVHPERPTVARTIFLILENMLCRFYVTRRGGGGGGAEDVLTPEVFIPQRRAALVLLWTAGSSMANEKLDEWMQGREGLCVSAAHVSQFREFIEFSDALDLKLQAYNWLSSDDPLLTMGYMRRAAVASAVLAGKQAVISTPAGIDIATAASKLVEMFTCSDKSKNRRLEHEFKHIVSKKTIKEARNPRKKELAASSSIATK